jgi:insulysin
LCNNSEIKNEIISFLLNKIIKLELNEILYMAEESDVEFKIDIKYNKLQIKIKGFNDSLKSGLEEFLINIKNLELNYDKHKEMFELQKQDYIKSLNNIFLKQSYKVNLECMKMLLQTGYNDPKEILDCLSTIDITLDDLINFKKNMFLETKSVWLIMGNIKKETALEIVKSTNEIFNLDVNKTITKSFYSKRAIELQQNVNYLYRFKHPNQSEQDSSIISVYQLGNLEKEQKMYYKILNSFFSEKFYDSLRTKETLGYIVYSTTYNLFEVYHLIFIIQGKVKEPEYCNERIKNFFNEKEKEIKEISDEEFNTIVKSLLVEETRKDIDLNEQFERNWEEIAIERFKFNVKEENAEYLKKCNKEGFINFYEKYFMNEAKILDVQYVSEKHWEDNEKKLKENKNYFGGNNNKRIIIDKIDDFHECNCLYPCCDNNYYRKINS